MNTDTNELLKKRLKQATTLAYSQKIVCEHKNDTKQLEFVNDVLHILSQMNSLLAKITP